MKARQEGLEGIIDQILGGRCLYSPLESSESKEFHWSVVVGECFADRKSRIENH